MLWNSKATHSNFKIKLRTFRVAAYTVYSKELAADSENPVWSESSFLSSSCNLMFSKSKLHGYKIGEKKSEYLAEPESSPE